MTIQLSEVVSGYLPRSNTYYAKRAPEHQVPFQYPMLRLSIIYQWASSSVQMYIQVLKTINYRGIACPTSVV